MSIVKAEFLWSRRCPLKCSYCNMVDGRRNTLTVEEWIKGIDNLRLLGCKFIAFYGAEPLLEFKKLGPVIRYAEACGIDTTVITSGIVPDFREKIKTLIHFGLRSLSMSFDIIPLDESSRKKSNEAIANLLWFQKACENYRDTAAIATLTRWNFRELPRSIEIMTSLGIWTFFDMVHDDRGQPGSKCKHTDVTESLLFRDKDLPDLVSVLHRVRSLKLDGHLCHTSLHFISIIEKMVAAKKGLYTWHCARESEIFPSWVTVDVDGSVLPCDDFHYNDNPINVQNLYDEWEEFSMVEKKYASVCPGCCWNTHIDAHAIKGGLIPISDYVHEEKS